VNSILNIILNIHKKFLLIVYIAMVIVLFTQVIFRYILKSSLMWSADAATILFIWLVFISAAYSTEKGSHYVMNVFSNKLPQIISKILDAIAYLAVLFVSFVIAYYGYHFLILTKSGISPALGLSLGWIYIVFPISGFLTIYYLIIKLPNNFKKKIRRK